jgi:hypothetical protein
MRGYFFDNKRIFYHPRPDEKGMKVRVREGFVEFEILIKLIFH